MNRMSLTVCSPFSMSSLHLYLYPPFGLPFPFSPEFEFYTQVLVIIVSPNLTPPLDLVFLVVVFLSLCYPLIAPAEALILVDFLHYHQEQAEEGSLFASRGTSLQYPPKWKKRRKGRGETEEEEEEVGGGAATTNAEECEDSPGLRTVLPAQISTRRKRQKRKEETEDDGEELTRGGAAAAAATNAEENEDSSNLKLLHPNGTTDSEKAERTIFVGNLPLGIKPKRIAAYFKSYGQVESVRLRSLAIKGTKVANSGDQILVRRVCAMKGETDASVKVSTFFIYFIL